MNIQFGQHNCSSDMAAEIMRQMCNAGASQFGAAAMPAGGRPLTPAVMDSMIRRRAANICQEAAAAGWKLRGVNGGPSWGWRFQFSDAVQIVEGAASMEPAQALINACETVASKLGIK